MKLHTRLILVLFLSIGFTPGNAQAPGYLGKRASVLFNFSGGFALTGPTQNNKGSNYYGINATSDNEEIGFNHEYQVDFSYVLNRYRSLELGVSQYYTGMVSDARTTSADGSGLDNHYLFYRLNVKSISLNYSKYTKKAGALAPIGGHYYFGLKTNFVNGGIIDKRTQFDNPAIATSLGHKLLNINQELKLHYFTWGWSNSLVFADKIIFNAGISGAIPLSWIGKKKYFSGVEAHPEFETNRNQAEFENNVFYRLWRHELLRMNIGIGYLIF